MKFEINSYTEENLRLWVLNWHYEHNEWQTQAQYKFLKTL